MRQEIRSSPEGSRDWTADEVKGKLRGRYAATQQMGVLTVPGQWTCLEEFDGIDLLAVSAVKRPNNAQRASAYPRIGHEVKVSRTDLRSELLNPSKRAEARDWCNEFYFVVPRGLLTPEELAWEEPEHFADPESFKRVLCDQRGCTKWFPPIGNGKRGRRAIGTRYVEFPTVGKYPRRESVPCSRCEGKGYLDLSLVEREAPTCWIPRDVGLILVDGRGCRAERKSPLRVEVPALTPGCVGALVRWTSSRPDPRHEGVIEASRERSRELAAREREYRGVAA